MLNRVRAAARTLSVISLLAISSALAQTPQPVTSSSSEPQARPRRLSRRPKLQNHLKSIPPNSLHAPTRALALTSIRTSQIGNKRFQHLESDLKRPNLHYSELNDLRDELQRIRGDVHNFRNHLEPALAAAKSELSLLGPAPAAGQPPEPDDIARSRADRNYYLGMLSAAKTAINSANLRIDNLIDAIQDIRRKNFTTSLLQPVPGVFCVRDLVGSARLCPIRYASRRRHPHRLVGQSQRQGRCSRSLSLNPILLLLALFAAAGYGTWRLHHRSTEVDKNPFWRRAVVAGAGVLLWMLPVVVPIAFVYGRVAQTHELPERVDWLLYATAQSIIVILAVSVLAVTVFAPRAPYWRLIPLSDRTARRVCGLVLALAVVYGITTLAYTITRVVQAPFSLTIAVALPSSLLQAGIIAAILLTSSKGSRQEATLSPRLLAVLRAPAWIAVFAIVVSAIAGYLALARFLAQQVVVTGSILAFAYVLLLLVDGLMHGLGDDQSAIGRWIKDKSELQQNRREQLILPLGLFLKAVVIAMSAPLILLQWGYTWPDIYEWYTQLFYGFRIGNTQVSIAVVLASIIVFGLAYGAARLFQGWLDERVLKPAGVSGSIRDSIRVGVGYSGVVLAAIAAFSYAGFSLSNLAILAGAFSVGIGFGLQSVVNNFVSGLILLAERPIKVGDLVVIGSEEGYVRKISVRSTEVETFDRASVVIPNSYLITEKVKNWTLRDNIRRIAIPVKVAHSSDPDVVKSILLKAAKDHPSVLTLPAPSYDFEDFDVDGLKFKLYAFVDMRAGGNVTADLRIAILKAFRETGDFNLVSAAGYAAGHRFAT